MNDSRIQRLERDVAELSTDMKWVRRHLESQDGKVDKVEKQVARAGGIGWVLTFALPVFVSVVVSYFTGVITKQ